MTNNKQQTAVEWFWNQLPEILPFTVDTQTAIKLLEAYQKAKEMGKWQIKETASAYYHENTKLTPTQYYEQTYGGGEQ